MSLDRGGAFGCGMCNADSVTAPVSEIPQTKNLINFIVAGPGNVKRVLLIPEITFYQRALLERLPFASNIAAVIVFPGFPGDANTTEAAITPSSISTDSVDPNFRFWAPNSKSPDFGFNNDTDFRTTNAQFQFYPFNIFRVNSTVASRIRERVAKFSKNDDDTAAFDASISSDDTAPMSATYVVQSTGKMFACPENAREQYDLSALQNGNAPFKLPNSTDCLRDNTCLPVGGQSVWSSLGALRAPKVKEVLAVTAPMDSSAFFHDIAQGAAAEVSSLATLMAVAEAVAEYRRGPGKDKVMTRQPVYFAWTAQAWGFTGSSRFLVDVKEFECEVARKEFGKAAGCTKPYKGSTRFKDFVDADWSVLNVNSIINPGPAPRSQVSNADEVTVVDGGLFMHSSTSNSSELRDILATSFPSNVSISTASKSFLLPDASHSFAQFAPGADVVSLSNFDSTFKNRFYHSQFDNVSLIPPSQRQPLYDAAQGIARTVISMCFGDTDPTFEIATETINGFIGCMTSNWSATPCELSKKYQGEEVFEDGKQSVRSGNYAGLFVPDVRAEDYYPSAFFKTDLIRNFLAFHNRFGEGNDCQKSADCDMFAEDLNRAASNATESLIVAQCSRGKCVASDTFLHDAYGQGIKTTAAFGAERTSKNRLEPQFEVVADLERDEKNEAEISAGAAPVFTESYWEHDLGICGFTEDSAQFGVIVLFSGIAVNILSMFVAWLLARRLLPQKVKEEVEPGIGDSGMQSTGHGQPATGNGYVAVQI